MLLLFYLVIYNMLQCAASFAVKVPRGPVVALRGATAFLSCEFTSNTSTSNLIITWQRAEDARVVHSYYYQRDQLDRQSLDYRNRTTLNHRQLMEGNASLKMTNFGLKDAGDYLCIVTNSLGTDRGVVRLVYAVLYSEPRLSIHLNSTDVTVQYETEGYPRPEVMWLSSGGQNLSDQREISSATDEGLYYLRSSYISQSPAFNITFTLINPAVPQELHRHVTLNYDGNASVDKSVVFLAVLCSFLMCSTGVLLWLYRRKQRHHFNV